MKSQIDKHLPLQHSEFSSQLFFLKTSFNCQSPLHPNLNEQIDNQVLPLFEEKSLTLRPKQKKENFKSKQIIQEKETFREIILQSMKQEQDAIKIGTESKRVLETKK